MSIVVRMAEPGDLQSIVKLLNQGKLNSEGIENLVDNFMIVENVDTGEMVGTAGLEMLGGRYGLLRSLTVKEESYSTNIVLGLIKILLQVAAGKGVERIFLFTKSTPFFELLGFEPIEREQVPGEIQQSTHFKQNKPELSTVMVYNQVDKLRISLQN
jgi:amino-acid N-acetyltransferase